MMTDALFGRPLTSPLPFWVSLPPWLMNSSIAISRGVSSGRQGVGPHSLDISLSHVRRCSGKSSSSVVVVTPAARHWLNTHGK
jgi:hypothetical protein